MDKNTSIFLKYVDTIQSICKVKGYTNAKAWINDGKDCKLNMSEKVHLIELINNRNTIAHQGINIGVSQDDIKFLYKIIESTGFDMNLLKVYNSGNGIEKKQEAVFHLVLKDRIDDIDLDDIDSIRYDSYYKNDGYVPSVTIWTKRSGMKSVHYNAELYTFHSKDKAYQFAKNHADLIFNALKKYKFNN